jgi:hypothetical protein
MRAVLAAAASCLLLACGGESPAPAPQATPAPAAAPAVAAGDAQPARPGALAADTVLATVGDRQVTAGDLDAAIAALPAPDRAAAADRAQVREILETLIDRPLMAAAARADGLADDPVMKEMLKPEAGATALDSDEMLAGVWLETELAKLPPPDEAAVARYYQEHAAEFTQDGQPQPLDAVRDEIRARLEEARRRDATERIRARLRKGVTVSIEEERLAAW